MFLIKTDILSRIDSEILELQRRRDLIDNLEIAPVDEKTWNDICLSPARYYGSLLLEIAKETFPNGESFVRNANEIIFTLNDFEVKVPTSAIEGVVIDLSWFNPEYKEPPKGYRRYDKMRKYFELIDSGDYTWYDLACCRCEVYTDEYNKTKLFLWWFLKAKWHKVDRKKWEEHFAIEDKKIEERKKGYLKNIENTELKLSKLKETVAILKEFAEVRGRIDGQMVNVEEYFNQRWC